MQASWPRPISGVEPVFYLIPDERQEIRIKRPASHTTLDGSSFIPRVYGRRKGMFRNYALDKPMQKEALGRALPAIVGHVAAVASADDSHGGLDLHAQHAAVMFDHEI